MRAKIEYIFFDFNGTIIDDLDLCYQTINVLLAKCHHPKISLQRYLEIFTFPVKEYYVLAGFDFKIDSFQQLSHEFMALYQPNSLKCQLHEGIIELLIHLRKNNKKIILLTASQHDYVLQQLHHFNIHQYFDDILANNDIYANGKLELAKKFIEDNKINPRQVVLIGDTIHDYEVASHLGIRAILYDQGHQSRKRLLSTGALVINQLSKIKPII